MGRHRTRGHAGLLLDGGTRGPPGMGKPGPPPALVDTRGSPPEGWPRAPPYGGWGDGAAAARGPVTGPDRGARSRSYNRDGGTRGAAPGRRPGPAPDTGGKEALLSIVCGVHLGGWRREMSAKNPPGRGVLQGGRDGEGVAQIPRVVTFADPPAEEAEGPQARYSTRRAQGPLLVTTPLGFRMRRYEQSFNARRLMMSRARFAGPSPSALYNQIYVFRQLFILQRTPEFFIVKGF